MKVIDLLNKIANGKEVPKKISAFGKIFDLKDSDYFTNDDCDYLLGDYVTFHELNTEIEIVEEPKRIEPFTEEEMKIYHDMSAPIDDLAHKVSLIIDYINSKEDNNE